MTKLFVLGNAFCGSTILGNALNGHPRITNVGEFNRIPGFHQFDGDLLAEEQYSVGCTLCELLNRPCPVWTPSFISELGAMSPSQAFDRLELMFPGKTLLDCSKPAEWLRQVAENRASGKSFKVIHCVRSAISYCASYRIHTGLPVWQGANYWRDQQFDIMRTCSDYQIPCLVVHYEEFAWDPEATLRKVCDFIEIPYDAQMMDFKQVETHALGGNYSAFVGYPGASFEHLPAGIQRGIGYFRERPFGGWKDEKWFSQLSLEEISLVLRTPGVGDLMSLLGFDVARELAHFVQAQEGRQSLYTPPTDPNATADDLEVQSRFQRIFMNDVYRHNRKCENQVARFVEEYGIGRDALIVDFGCGAGHACRYLAEAHHRCLGIDIAANALHADSAGRFPFLRANVWRLPFHLQGDYGFATDLLQTIPEPHLDKTLNTIRSSINHETFFNISVRRDGYGQRIGERLHQTVRPREWWLERLGRHFTTIRPLAEDPIDESFEVVVSG